MALASERFSIREYTSKMRSVDVLKFWPFGETKKKESVEAFLPPITVQKFKWWAEELDPTETETEAAGGLSCPVSVKSVNAHVHKCLAQSLGKEQIRTMKAKSRVPKKRSIVEIFAVAPQVDKVYYHDEDEDEDDGESGDAQEDEFHDVKLLSLIHVGLNEKRKRKMKLKEGSLAIVDKLKKLKKVQKNGKRKERNDASIDLSTKKENSLKLKKEHPLKCCSSSHTMGLTKNLLDAIPVHRNKPRPEFFMTKKKTSTFGTSKLTLEQQKSGLSVCGILKNHSKVASGKKSTLGNLRESSEAKWCDIPQSDRRVRFSGKDDILGQRMKSAPPAEFPKLQNIFCSYSKGGAASLEMDHFAERGKSFFTAEVNGSDKSSSICEEYDNGVPSITENKASDMCVCVGKPNFLRPHINQEHVSNRTVTSNQVAYSSENLHWLEHGYRVGSHDPFTACPSGLLSLEKKAYKPNLITRGSESMSIASDKNGKVIAHNRDPSPRISAMCYGEYVNAFSQPSSSYFTNDNGNGYGRLLYPAEETSDYIGQNLQCHPFRYLTPKELMHSICSLPDLDKRGVMHVERSMNEDFVGLPLNSQGEVTQLNSSDKSGFNQLSRPSTVTDSFRTFACELPSNPGNYLSFQNCDERAPSENQFQLFSVQDRVKENTDFIAPSRLDITELESTGRSDVPFLDFLKGSGQSDYHLDLGLDLMNIPSHRNKQCEQIWDYSGKRKIHQERNADLMSLNVTQPTMRLMGQEFSVGKNYRNLHDDENVWMDKQIIAEHRPANTNINNSLRRHFQPDFIIQPASGKGKEIECSSEIQISLASQSILEIKPPESRFSQPYVSCPTSAAYENAFGTFSRFPITSSYPYYPPYAYPTLFNKEPIFQEPFLCEPLPVNPLPMPSSPHNTFENVTLNYTQSNKQQKKPPPTSSAFKFPFLRPDVGEPARPSCCQSSFKSLPQWLLNATQAKETTIGSFQSYSDAVGNCHPCTMSGNNYQKIPSVYCTPDASYMYNPLSIQSPLQNASGLASIGQSPFVPVRHRFSQTSTMNNRREYRMKVKEEMRAKFCVKDPFHGKKTKKRPSAKSDYFANPTKLPNLEISEDSSRGATDLKAIGVTGVDVQGRREEFGLDLAKDVANSMECVQNATQMDASKAFTEIDTLKVNGIARPGPVKLTAGVKHILKPSESMYQSKSRLTHSKIPFAAVTSCDIVSGSDQIKPAKIYRF